MTLDPLSFMRYQQVEHEAWLDVVKEMRIDDVASINKGEPNEALHDAITRWAEELVQLRLHDPDPRHAAVALIERREAYEKTTRSP